MSAPVRSPVKARDLQVIEERLGHRFARRDLLDEALTHGSASEGRRKARRNNERLEFLGDRVLGLAVAELLIRRYPDDSEGALSPRFAVLVSAPVLADIAQELGLGAWLTLARSEAEDGGRAKPVILADALEAVIGALYLDGGWEVAAAFVHRHVEPRLGTMAVPPRDPKSTLQEWTQARALGLPSYRVVGAEGPDHAPAFEVAVEVRGLPVATARAPSKRAAEQAAAQAMLERLAGGAARE